MIRFKWSFGLCFLFFATVAFEAKETVSLKVKEDTYICAFPIGTRSTTVKSSEQGANAGASKRLKIKKNENYVVLKFDFGSLPKNMAIQKGVLKIHELGGKGLRFIGVSTLHVPWAEGKGLWDDDGKPDLNHKGACFLGPMGIDTNWIPDQASDFVEVCYGEAGGMYKSLLSNKKENGLYEIEIPVEILELARKNGQTLVLSDDTGLFDGEKDNAFISSRESNEPQTELVVTFDEISDSVKPVFSEKLVLKQGPYPGSIIVKLPNAKDDQGSVLNYEVFVNGKILPWHLVPNPSRLNKTILLEGYKASEKIEVVVKAYDLSGNFVETKNSGLSAPESKIVLEAAQEAPAGAAEIKASATNDQYSIKIVNGLTLFDPLTGKAFSHQTRDHAEAPQNLYSAVQGEFLGLQVLIELNKASGLKDITFDVSDLKSGDNVIDKKNIEAFREHYVHTNGQWIADILPSIDPEIKMAIPSQSDLEGQKSLGVYVDVYVPKDAKPGLYKGEFKINTDQGELKAFYSIWVRGVVLPDELSFIVEMNAYNHSGDKNVFHETYRLLHKNRLSYNVVGYGQNSPSNFCAPVLNSKSNDGVEPKDTRIVDWSKYDEYYGPLFSGEIAMDLPRKGEPASHWYLPFHDSWPVHLKVNHPELWSSRAIPKQDMNKFNEWKNFLAENELAAADHFRTDWREGSSSVTQQLRDHFKEKGWTKTSFQIFSNGKFYFDTGSSTLWTMDEPQFGRDYLALDFVYSFFRKYMDGAGLNVVNRADISRPQLVGSRMDESLDFVVVSSALNLYVKMIRNWRILHLKSLWWYGGGASAEADPLHYTVLFFDKWKRGCDGGMPQYTTFAGTNDWSKTDSLRVVRFDPETKLPVSTFRMKAYRFGQQNVELLNLLPKARGWNVWQLREVLDEAYPTKSVIKSLNPDDPGTSVFEGLSYTTYQDFREKIIATLLKK